MRAMMIGQLSARTGLPVRTLRFYADTGVLPESGRTESGYRLFDAMAVSRARLVRTLRELGVGLDDVRRVLADEASLQDVATAHARALDAQIRVLHVRRAVLAAVAQSNDPQELERMNDLTALSGEERRRVLEDYLDAVFGSEPDPVADRMRLAAPSLPEAPTADQVAAWVELAELLRDPDYIEASRRMSERAREEGAAPDGGHIAVEAIGEHAGEAVRLGLDATAPEALTVIQRIEGLGPDVGADRTRLAARIEGFTDRRTFRYWTLVAVINGWDRPPVDADSVDAWEWYVAALRAHADGDSTR